MELFTWYLMKWVGEMRFPNTQKEKHIKTGRNETGTRTPHLEPRHAQRMPPSHGHVLFVRRIGKHEILLDGPQLLKREPRFHFNCRLRT